MQVGIIPHWLSIDGTQPRIPENEFVERPKVKRPRATQTATRNVRARNNAGKPLLYQARVKLSVRNCLFERVTVLIEKTCPLDGMSMSIVFSRSIVEEYDAPTNSPQNMYHLARPVPRE